MQERKSETEGGYMATVATTATELAETPESVATVATVASSQSDFSNSVPLALYRLWRENQARCRSYGSVMADARAGRIPGVWLTAGLFGYVTNRGAALDAMQKFAPSKSSVVR